MPAVMHSCSQVLAKKASMDNTGYPRIPQMDERAGNPVCLFSALELCTELLKLIRAGHEPSVKQCLTMPIRAPKLSSAEQNKKIKRKSSHRSPTKKTPNRVSSGAKECKLANASGRSCIAIS